MYCLSSKSFFDSGDMLRTKEGLPEALFGLVCIAAHIDGSCAEVRAWVRMKFRDVM